MLILENCMCGISRTSSQTHWWWWITPLGNSFHEHLSYRKNICDLFPKIFVSDGYKLKRKCETIMITVHLWEKKPWLNASLYFQKQINTDDGPYTLALRREIWSFAELDTGAQQNNPQLFTVSYQNNLLSFSSQIADVNKQKRFDVYKKSTTKRRQNRMNISWVT